MATQVQIRRGTTAQHAAFTGAAGEVTVDTDKGTVVIHNGSTAGGFPALREDASNSALALGSAGTPSLKFTGDTNTGIYSPGADQVAISTNGTQRLTTDTAAVTSTLPVVHPLGAAATPSLTFTGDLNTGIYSPGADQVAVATGGTGRLFVDASGNVGVATSSPGAKFDVNGNIRANGDIVVNSSTAAYTLGTVSDTSLELGTSASATPRMVFRVGATERARFDSSGRLGVGTSSPSASSLLDVNGNARIGSAGNFDTDTRLLVASTGGNAYIQIQGADSTGTVGLKLGRNSSANNAGFDWSASTDKLTFRTGGTSAAMTIDASQRVGIGTSSPAAELQINKSSDVGLALSNSSSVTSGNRASIYCLNSANSTVGKIRFGAVTDNVGTEIQFYTRPAAGSLTQSMTLDSSGRLGIGTTSPGTKLHLEESSTDCRLRIISGTTFDAAIQLGDTASFSQGAIIYDNAADALRFQANGSERARIDSSGRLLVGTSSSFDAHCTLQIANQYAAQFFRWGSDGCEVYIGSARGNQGSPSALNNSDNIGALNFRGHDGSAYRTGASIAGVVDGGVGSSDFPGRLVFSTTADGSSSPTERMRIGANGEVTAQQSAAGLGCYGADSSSASYTGAQRYGNVARSANSAYSFFTVWSGNYSDIEFNLRGDGTGLCDGSWTGGGADYAEYFEWSDSNPDAADRRGISVVLDGDKIREAAAGEDPIGVISGNPSVVGDSAWNKWSGKYLRDEFGSYTQEDYEVEDEDGNTVIQQRRKLNPVYDPDVEYISREQRPEWDCVGLMGKLRIRKGQITGSRWIKMRDISDSVEEWLVR